MPVYNRTVICTICYIYITSLAILARCFDSTKSSNYEGSKLVYFRSYFSNIFILFFSYIFLFYFTNYSYKYTKRLRKKQGLKNSIKYIVSSIESRKIKEKQEKKDREKDNKCSFSFLATSPKFTLIKIGMHPIFLIFLGKFMITPISFAIFLGFEINTT